jgi:hypothetical protein
MNLGESVPSLGLARVLVAIASVAVFGCGQSPITPARIETAIESTFANLIHVQISWLGLPPTAASDFVVTASCRKLLAGNAGAGDWECRLVWQSPDRRIVHDTYDLVVATDGCYTATAAGENLIGPTLKSRDGRDVRNLLYVFEGCFDTT